MFTVCLDGAPPIRMAAAAPVLALGMDLWIRGSTEEGLESIGEVLEGEKAAALPAVAQNAAMMRVDLVMAIFTALCRGFAGD
jgi:hypothetical protein